MSEAEELLESLAEEDYTAGSGNKERHIVIGRDRYITVPEELKKIAVQFDHDIETVTFDCPAFWDENELSTMKVYVNFVRADGYIDKKVCTNVALDAVDKTIMHFDWTVSKNVTLVQGPIRFLVCIKKVNANGEEKNHWNSEINEDMYVSEGLEVEGDAFEKVEKDIITDLLVRMEKAESVLDMTWVNATDEKLEKLEDGKVNRSGDTITGDLEVQGALSMPNAVDTPETTVIEAGYSSRQTANGADIVDGSLARVKTIKGKTVKTTNLIPYPYITGSTTNNGMTFTDDGDGAVTLNGTSTADCDFILGYIPCRDLVAGSAYVFSIDIPKPSGTVLVVGLYDSGRNWVMNLPADGFTVTQEYIDSGYYLRPIIFIYANTTLNNCKLRPMLNEGTEALPYTPYFAGLKHTHVKAIKSTGKNLIKLGFPDRSSLLDVYVGGVDIPTGTVVIETKAGNTSTNGLAYTGVTLSELAPSLQVGETYTLSGIPATGGRDYIYLIGANRSIKYGSSFTVTQADLNSEFVIYGKEQSGAWTATISNIMINHGSTALPFEPYKENIYELPEAVELGEWDEIDISAGKVVRCTNQIVLTGKEVWSLNNQALNSDWGNVYMRAIGQGALYSRAGVCSHYDTGVWDVDFTAGKKNVFAATADVILFKTDGVQTLDEFKAYLAAQYEAGTPVTIDVRLASIIEEDIDIPKTYAAYDKGSEIIVQGDEDNGQWGAVPTVTQEYLHMVDPIDAACKAFVLNTLARMTERTDEHTFDILKPVVIELGNMVGTMMRDIANIEDGTTVVKKAEYAVKANSATEADSAVYADDAQHAFKANSADEATHAVNADEATHAVNADDASMANQAKSVREAIGGIPLADIFELEEDDVSSITPVVRNATEAENANEAESLAVYSYSVWVTPSSEAGRYNAVEYDYVLWGPDVGDLDLRNKDNNVVYIPGVDGYGTVVSSAVVPPQYWEEYMQESSYICIKVTPGTEFADKIAEGYDSETIAICITSQARYAEYATHADSADEAYHAVNADNASEATHAVNADEATHAVNADNASEATHAVNADNADTLKYRYSVFSAVSSTGDDLHFTLNLEPGRYELALCDTSNDIWFNFGIIAVPKPSVGEQNVVAQLPTVMYFRDGSVYLVGGKINTSEYVFSAVSFTYSSLESTTSKITSHIHTKDITGYTLQLRYRLVSTNSES